MRSGCEGEFGVVGDLGRYGGYFAGYSVCGVSRLEFGGRGSFGGEFGVILLGIFLRCLRNRLRMFGEEISRLGRFLRGLGNLSGG